MTQAMVDILAAQAAHQRRSQVQLFECAVRAGQGANAVSAIFRLDLFQTIGDILKRSLPIDRFPFATLLEHRTEQAVIGIQGFVRKAVAISNPAFVDCFVFKRKHAHDLVVLDLNNQVGAG